MTTIMQEVNPLIYIKYSCYSRKRFQIFIEKQFNPEERYS